MKKIASRQRTARMGLAALVEFFILHFFVVFVNFCSELFVFLVSSFLFVRFVRFVFKTLLHFSTLFRTSLEGSINVKFVRGCIRSTYIESTFWPLWPGRPNTTVLNRNRWYLREEWDVLDFSARYSCETLIFDGEHLRKIPYNFRRCSTWPKVLKPDELHSWFLVLRSSFERRTQA